MTQILQPHFKDLLYAVSFTDQENQYSERSGWRILLRVRFSSIKLWHSDVLAAVALLWYINTVFCIPDGWKIVTKSFILCTSTNRHFGKRMGLNVRALTSGYCGNWLKFHYVNSLFCVLYLQSRSNRLLLATMYLGKFTMNEAFKKNSNCRLFGLNKELSSVNMTCKTRLQHIYPSLVLVIKLFSYPKSCVPLHFNTQL